MRTNFIDHLKELLVHQFNLNNAMGREAAASGYGLPNPERFAHPYPGSTNNIFVVDAGDKKPPTPPALPPAVPLPKPAKRGLGLWGAVGLTVAAAALPTALGVAGLAYLYEPPTTTVNLPAVPPGMKRIIEESKDGGKTWTPIPVVKE